MPTGVVWLSQPGMVVKTPTESPYSSEGANAFEICLQGASVNEARDSYAVAKKIVSAKYAKDGSAVIGHHARVLLLAKSAKEKRDWMSHLNQVIRKTTITSGRVKDSGSFIGLSQLSESSDDKSIRPRRRHNDAAPVMPLQAIVEDDDDETFFLAADCSGHPFHEIEMRAKELNVLLDVYTGNQESSTSSEHI